MYTIYHHLPTDSYLVCGPFTNVYDSIADADSIEELLYKNPELLL